MAGIELEIVTPEGVVFNDTVDEVIAPSVQGEFGVLPGHLPMLAALNIGLLHYKTGSESIDVAVGKGFAEVIHDKALILTDRYMVKDDVEILEVRKRLKKVDEELESWDGELDDAKRLSLIEEEQWLAAQLELYGDPPVPRVLEQSRSLDYRNIIPEAESDEIDADGAQEAEEG